MQKNSVMTQSQNRTEAGRHLWRSLVQPSAQSRSPRAGHSVQMYFQGQRVYNFFGQPFPVFDHLTAKKFFRFKYFCLCPLPLVQLWEPPVKSLALSSSLRFNVYPDVSLKLTQHNSTEDLCTYTHLQGL